MSIRSDLRCIAKLWFITAVGLSESQRTNLSSDSVEICRFDTSEALPEPRSVTVKAVPLNGRNIARGAREITWINASIVEELGTSCLHPR